MAVKPDDPYNPVSTEAPETGMTNDTLSVRATPSDFGAQVGEATQGLGQQLNKVSGQAYDYLVQRQGMINETLATDAETEYATQAGKVVGAYKSKEGLEAVAATDPTIEQLRSIRQNVLKSLPNPAAARAFNLLASRRESYSLADISAYSASQVKAADNRSAASSLEFSINSASDPTVATSPQQYADLKANIKFQVARVITNQGYGADGGTGMVQDPKTGDVTFNDTEAGQQAKAVYRQMLDKSQGQADINKYQVLLDDPRDGSAQRAMASFNVEADSIPVEARAKISAMLVGPVRTAQTRVVAQGAIANLDQGYLGAISGRITGKYNGNQLVDSFIDQESNNGKTSTNLGQIQPGTWARFSKPGEKLDNPVDNKHVTARYLDYLQKNYGGDPERVAVGYFSGEGNIAPAGSPTPWKQDLYDKNKDGTLRKSVSSYVNDIVDKLNVKSSVPYINRADYYKQNFGDAVDQSYNDYLKIHEGDITGAEQARAQTEQHINDVIRTQAHEDSADRDLISRAGRGEFNKDQPYTSEQQFLTGPPEVRAAWQRFQVNDPLGYQTYVTKTLPANSRGPSLNFGSDTYKYVDQILSGQPINLSHIPVSNTPTSNLTTTGLKQLQELQGLQTPQNQPFNNALHKFFKQAYGPITLNNASPGVHNADGEARYTKFLQEVIPNILKEKSSGKSIQAMFDSNSQDYVGKTISHYVPDISQMTKEMVKSQATHAAQVQTFNSGSIKTKEDLFKAFQGKQINEQQFRDLAIKLNLAKAPPPPVPVGIQ